MKKTNQFRWIGWAAFLAAVAVLAAVVPQKLDNYYMTVLNAAMLWSVAVFGLSLLMGMGGMMSFATVAFMGIGAYSTAQFSMSLGMPPLLSVALATLMGVLFAFLVGLLILKLKDAYFAFATIGVVQVAYAFFLNYKPLTGGPNGLPGVPKLVIGSMEIASLADWFRVLAVVVLLGALILERIRRTSLGRSLAAIRDSEVVAQTQGIDVYRTKIIAFMISGAYGGLAGALLAHMNSYISAYLFTFDLSVRFLVMVMLGGVSSTVGSFLGTILVSLVPEWFRSLESYMKLIYGFTIILLMIFMPMGLTGIFQKIAENIRIKRHPKRKGGEEA